MFDSFTVQARQSVVQAQEAARDLRHDTLDSGSLLLGLLRLPTDIAALALADQGIDIAMVQAQVAVQRPPVLAEPWEEHIPFTAEAKSLFALAYKECRERAHERITTGHLVLAMIRLPNSAAAQTLSALGVDPGKVEAEVLRLSDPAISAELREVSNDFHALLIEAAGWGWPKPRARISTLLTSIFWYLVTGGLMALLELADARGSSCHMTSTMSRPRAGSCSLTNSRISCATIRIVAVLPSTCCGR